MSKKAPPTDGLGPKERKRLASVIREVWYQCHARKLAIKRCMDKEGFSVCSKCKQRTPRIQIDHLVAAGAVDSNGHIKRMFCSSMCLRGLCPECHTIVTNLQNEEKRASPLKKRRKPLFMDT